MRPIHTKEWMECIQMRKFFRTFLAVMVAAVVVFAIAYGYGRSRTPISNSPKPAVTPGTTVAEGTQVPSTPTPLPVIDVSQVKPNEAGKIMVVMFHNFVQSFTPTKSDDGQYTTTFDDFRKLLPVLYDKGYRLISLNDYLKNNISVPAGCIPMVFTFDDGTSGQFNLVEDNGKLVAAKNSAVGIMEEFNKTHPDFGLKATFFVNLGLSTFEGNGTVYERLKYLMDDGFEIGNHTMTHIHLNEAKSAEQIEKEIGGNQKKMYELVPDYKMNAFALPFGQATKDLQAFVVKGEYEGVAYENSAIMEVGWDPAPSPVSKKFNPLSTHRVRASGMKAVQADLAWWLKNLSRNDQYISDGDPGTVSVPKSREADLDKSKLGNKRLNIY